MFLDRFYIPKYISINIDINRFITLYCIFQKPSAQSSKQILPQNSFHSRCYQYVSYAIFVIFLSKFQTVIDAKRYCSRLSLFCLPPIMADEKTIAKYKEKQYG